MKMSYPVDSEIAEFDIVLRLVYGWKYVPVSEVDPDGDYPFDVVLLPPNWEKYRDVLVLDAEAGRYQLASPINRVREHAIEVAHALRKLADSIENAEGEWLPTRDAVTLLLALHEIGAL